MTHNAIIVRNPKGRRIFAVVFSALAMITITCLVIYLWTTAALLLYIPLLIILLPLIVFTVTWQIRFEKDHISEVLCFRKVKTYPYTQLREVTQQYFTSEHGYCIRMHFTDGKTIQFRMDDEGAARAVKLLCKHRSIKKLPRFAGDS